MRAVEGMIPPQGWHFVQDGVTINASGYRGKDGILQAILEYRISNDKDIGDVEQEFLEWFCKEYPRNCQFPQDRKSVV